MSNFLTRILGAKKDWKAMEGRADALPRDYRIVHAETSVAEKVAH